MKKLNQLFRLLEELAKEGRVIVASDPEGNSFHPIDEAQIHGRAIVIWPCDCEVELCDSK